jgi:tetratricopeptide (TPR) repeat protein
MPRLRFRPLIASVLVLTLVMGAGLLLHGQYTRPLLEAGRLENEGRINEALTTYRAAADRFERSVVTRFVFTREHALALAHELALLYRAGDYNAVIDRASGSPAAAAPHFWAGLALMQLGMREGKEDVQLTWFSRAEEELRLALQAAPQDWDTKVNYEIAARIVTAMRRQPKRAIENPMQLLRPQPAQGTPPRKVG